MLDRSLTTPIVLLSKILVLTLTKWMSWWIILTYN